MQIQAYLDNVFDVGTLLEDAETKTAALERVEELEENLTTVRQVEGETGSQTDRYRTNQSFCSDVRATAGRGERSDAEDCWIGETADANQQGAGQPPGLYCYYGNHPNI